MHLIVVTGIDPAAVDRAVLSLAWDSPRAVTVRHRIDPEVETLSRVVSDATGLLERETVELEHLCVSCALREDVVPTLERLARDGRWDTVVAALPTATEAVQLDALLAADTRLARRLRLVATVTAVTADRLATDLLTAEPLSDRGWHTEPADDRGIGETLCALVEHADVVVLDRAADAAGHELLQALARPDARLVDGFERLDGRSLVERRFGHGRRDGWRYPADEPALPALTGAHAWRLDLSSPRPFHPERLLDEVEHLADGPYRSRGCFWVPTRPGDALEWSGAGGQLSMGAYRTWSRRTPRTRLLLTGLGTPPEHLAAAFERLLVSPEEALLHARSWDVAEDGLEPWLGTIHDAA